MYILGVSGSPRAGGNTDTLLDKALEGAKSKGAETEKIILNSLKMVPCQECEEIKGDGTCKIEDDFQGLYVKIRKAGAIIFASPIFFGSLSAQSKIMIDRFQCLWRYKESLSASVGKPATVKTRPGALILVEASQRESFLLNAKSIVRNFFATADIDYKGELFCKGLEEKKAVLKQKGIMKKAFELGESLASI